MFYTEITKRVSKIIQINIIIYIIYALHGKGSLQKKNRLFLGKSPKLWVGGGQES